ncbi:hypothetical protein MTO96_024345 [Rhipicephalus appendiculatus]
MWLVDEEHFEDQMMCLLSLVMCISLAMVLTFAWLEADLRLAGWPWLLAALVVILLALQTCIWMCFTLYSLWRRAARARFLVTVLFRPQPSNISGSFTKARQRFWSVMTAQPPKWTFLLSVPKLAK